MAKSLRALLAGPMAEEFNLSDQALSSATSYLTGELSGKDIDQTPKYRGMMTDVLESTTGQTGGNFISQLGNTGQASAARAMGLSGVTNQKVNSALDEINKIRTQLGNNGVKTTALGAQAGGQAVQAFSMLPKEKPAVSALAGLIGAGSAVYGAFNKPTAGGTSPNYTSLAPVSAGAFGGDTAYLQSGNAFIDPTTQLSMSQALYGGNR